MCGAGNTGLLPCATHGGIRRGGERGGSYQPVYCTAVTVLGLGLNPHKDPVGWVWPLSFPKDEMESQA